MGFLALIFDQPAFASIESVVGEERIVVPLDASISETHDRRATVTQNEIEDGANVADHVKLQPKGLSIEGIISDTPVSFKGSLAGLAVSSASQLAATALGGLGTVAGGLAAELVGAAVGSLAGLLTGVPRDPKDAFRYLEELWEKREPVTIQTALTQYENMVLTSLSVPKSAKEGKALRFNASFENVRIARSAIITVPAYQVAAAGAASAAKLGKQATKAATSRKASFLLTAIQKTTGAF